MVRFHTRVLVLTCGVGCGSGAAVPTGPAEPPHPIVNVVHATPDAAIDAPPPPPKLACAPGTTSTPAPAPEPTWFCARPDGARHGPFITLFPDAQIEISGTYKDNQLDGPWERRRPDGTLAERGPYAGGLKDGHWEQLSPTGAVLGAYDMVAGTGVEKVWLDDGTLYSETKLDRGIKNGPHKIYAPDGAAVVQARYANGKLDGAHSFGTRATMHFDEQFSNGVRHGARQIWLGGMLLAEENFDRRGRLDGPYTLWRSRKIFRAKGQFSSGRRSGAWLWNDRDGNKEREGSYVNGKRDGIWMEWFEQKLVFSGNYIKGRHDGDFIYFDRSGNEVGRYTMSDGTGVVTTFWNNRKPSSRQRLYKGVENGIYQELTPRGQVVVEGHYSSGLRHGSWKEFLPDGTRVLEQNWKNGKLNGAVKKFADGGVSEEMMYADGKVEGPFTEYRQGKPAVVGTFVDDRKSGTWTTYNNEGNVVLTATYKDGVLDGPWRQLVDGDVLEGPMVAGRRTGTWTRTDKAGTVRKLTYGPP